MKKIILSLAVLIAPIIAAAQDCSMYALSKVGSSTEYNQYDAKQKLTGKSSMKVIKSSPITGGASLDAETAAYDKNGKLLSKDTLSVKCENGVYYFDMSSYYPSKTMEGGTVEFKGDNLEIPANPVVGQTLKDGLMTVSMIMGTTTMNITVKIFNRKVEAIESVTTPAGTFECVKVSYDIETKMMMVIKGKGVQWFAKDVGMVKSESYDAKGNLKGSEELAKITK